MKIKVKRIKDNGDSYYKAYDTELGEFTCSAVGDTPKEAIAELNKVKADVLLHIAERSKK